MNAYRFEVPLVKPLVLKGQTHNVRNGILLERDGQWAEASPLPGFSTETLDHVVAALRGEQENPPSLKFALHALECPLRFPMNVPWNFLALGNQKQILDQIEKAKAVDCRVVKIKVGRDTVESDIVLIRNIHDRLPVGVRLRLDANQAWSFEEAVRFATGVGDLDWEYIEEPLQDPFRLEQLYRETGCKFALDETLLKVDSIDQWPSAVSLICKPTILGGRPAIERLAQAGIPLVFSSAFESGIGVARIVQLAAEFSPNIAAGLDTLDWLNDDLLVQSPVKLGDRFLIEQLAVDANRLERIEI